MATLDHDRDSAARNRAILETGLPPETFPLDCPFNAEQLLDPEYLPD